MLSVYTGIRTKKGLADATARIEVAFPGWSSQQTDVLKDRFAENGFTDQRMMDAVNHVIDTCRYPIPSVADFISFDMRVKVLTHKELDYKHSKGDVSWDDYQAVNIGLDKPRWARIEDVRKYGLTPWQQQP